MGIVDKRMRIKKSNPRRKDLLEVIVAIFISLFPQNTLWPYHKEEHEDNIVGNQ
jgi:hypothetical protein